MREILKIENMTLDQIKGLKKEISDEIENYLNDIMKIVNDKFDVGEIDVNVKTLINCAFDSMGNKILNPCYRASIKFSKEEL